MANWTLVPCLVALRDEFNQLSPNRDKASDGSIGDEAHADRSSHHNPDETGNTPYEDSDSKNEVHAIDVDKSGPWPSPMTFDLAIEELRKRHKDGRDDRLIEIIWNRRRTSPDSGWNWRDYTGSNAHTEHAHLAASYNSSRESDTSSFGLVEKWGDMSLSADDKEWISSEIKKYMGDVVPRYDEDGDKITGSGNDTMTVASGVEYTGRDLKWIIQDLAELKQAVAGLTPPPPAPAAKKTAAGK